LLSGLPSGLIVEAAAASGAPAAAPAAHFDLYAAIVFAAFMGLVIFATSTAMLYLRERRRWADQEGRLSRQIEDLRSAKDRAELLTGAERQVIVTWAGREGEPRFEGDPSIVAADATFRRSLAFGSWLNAADAALIEGAVARLRERGEGFRLILRTSGERFIEAEGRTLSGQALLRLRDVTGDRFNLLRCREEMAGIKRELGALHTLLDVMAQPVWLRDANGHLAWANRAYLAAVEAKDLDSAKARSAELLDRAARAELDRKGKDEAAVQARVTAVVAGARSVLDVFEAPLPDGGRAGIAIDVSELAAVGTELQREMQTHVRTLDQLSTAVAMFDARQRLVFHNAAYRQLWNIEHAFLDTQPTDSEILDRLRSARKLPEQADYRSWKASTLAAYRSPETQESWWHLPDGRTLRVVTNPNPQGGLIYLFDDVTEKVHLESRFNALLRVQGETLDTLKEGVAVFGTDGRLKLANRAFSDIWRIAPQELEPQPHIDEVISRCGGLLPDKGVWEEIRGAIAASPELRTGASCRMHRRDGSVFDCAAQPLPDGATLVTFIDVTASVNVERALTEKNEALERAAQLRDDFVHHVSYELRSPLTNVIGFTQLLGDGTVGPLNPRQREYAEHIMRSSSALLAILNDILDLASIDNDAMELSREVVDIRQTIDAAARGVEDRIAEASLKLEIDAPPDIGGFVADAKRVRQILFNLLSNAVGFSSAGQTVRVSARKVGGELILRVSDQGRGIPAEVKDKVFDRFESHTLGTGHRGVGLGLSIVRSFVELHGGRIELVSAPGAGTTVSCVFPLDGLARRVAAE
jgi:signal transduction histidine kinase